MLDSCHDFGGSNVLATVSVTVDDDGALASVMPSNSCCRRVTHAPFALKRCS